MRNRVAFAIAFGRAGDSTPHQLYGWASPEEGFTWTNGHFAALSLPAPRAPFGFFVELHQRPLTIEPALAAQQISVRVNGALIGSTEVNRRTCLAWFSAPVSPSEQSIVVTLELPTAARPVNQNDTRILGLAVSQLRILVPEEPVDFIPRMACLPSADQAVAATGLDLPALAMHFQSLGMNCEFGFFQRAVGIEPLGMFRFSSSLPRSLVAALDERFALIDDLSSIDLLPERDGSDSVVHHRAYDMRYHTWVPVGAATRDAMQVREAKKLSFLRRKMLDELAEGEKIFVLQSDTPLLFAEALAAFLAVRRQGNAALLWCRSAEPGKPPGLVEEVMPGMLCGRIGQFSPPTRRHQVSIREWSAVCAAAILLTERHSQGLLGPSGEAGAQRAC